MSAALDVAGLRAYQPDDLERVLRLVGGCCAETDFCGCLHPGDVAHFQSNTLRGGDPSERVYLCEQAGQLAALLLIYPAKFSGFDLVLAPAFRGSPLERDLIAYAERALLALGQTVASDVMDSDDIRRKILLDLGYVPGAAPSMIFTTRPLDLPIPDSPLPDGFRIRSTAGEHEEALLSAVHSGAFGSNWPPGEYLKVMGAPGFDIERELVVVAPDGRFAAFLIYWIDPVSRSGLFEPVGCHPDFQRRGLTQALLYEGMRRMVAGGATTAIVKHLTDNPTSTALYASVGFRPKYAMTSYSKNSEQS